jgi:ABC-2 type transport system ATP-binding protein
VPAIEVSELVVRYGSRSAVEGVSFCAEEGQVVALLGPNGAGKTTTVEVCEGYRRACSGRVRVLGLDPLADHRSLVAQVGVMLQQGGPYPRLSARRALRLYASYYRDSVDTEKLVSLVGLEGVADVAFRRLSGGEQRRVSLALALVGRPRVAFLDEPTAGVDPAGRRAIREVVRGLRTDGVCVLLTTHELDEAERLADSVVVIDHGRVVGAGTPAELMAGGAGGDIRFGAPPGLPVDELAGAMSALVVEESPGEYRVDCAATPAAVAALTAWLATREVPLGDLRAGRQSLEDVFLRLTSSGDGRLGLAGPDEAGPAGPDEAGPAGPDEAGPAGPAEVGPAGGVSD